MTKYDELGLDKALVNTNEKRKIITQPGDSQWGQLIIPGNNEASKKTKKGLKLLLFASYKLGYLLVSTLIEFEKKHPDKLNIVGLITDDPVNPQAKISMKRRIWRLFDDKEKFDIEDLIIEKALSFGIPCFTGQVKTEFARTLIHRWNPDAIQVCVFGQIIDSPIIRYPKLGIYNYHPADLAHHHGAGPRPFQDLIDRDAHTSLFTIHQLTEELDAGPVLGQSPPINVRNEDGSISDNILILEDKMTEPLDFMAVILTKSLTNHYLENRYEAIEKLNFTSYFSKLQKARLLEPIKEKKPEENMPNISEFALNLLDNY